MSTKTTSGTTIALGVAFLCILSVLHIWEPEYNPPHLISEYQLGRFGWLMSLAFLCLGAASIGLFVAARHHIHTRPGRFGSWGLPIIGVAYFMAGFFPPDSQRYLASLLHGIGGLVVILASPVVFTLVSMGLANNLASQTVRKSLLWTATLTWVGLALFCGSIVTFASGPGSVTVGWTNRFMITTYVLWLLVAAFHVCSRSR